MDTHAWIWWIQDNPDLSRAAKEALESAPEVGVPAACCWEVAWLHRSGRLDMNDGPRAWMRAALGFSNVRLLPLLPEIAALGASFGRQLPRDPADRQIVATALHHSAPLVTRYGPITRSGIVQTIW